MAQYFSTPVYIPVDGNGNPYPASTLSFFVVNSTTPLVVYSSLAGAVAQTATLSLGSVVTSNGSGVFPAIYIYEDSYRVKLTTVDGEVIYTRDISNSSPTALGVGSVATANLQSLCVTTNKIADDAVTTAKINAGAVGATELATDAVTTDKIVNLNVTTGKINDLAITTGKIAANAIVASKITDGIITGGAAGAGVKIAASTITTDNLASDCVTTAKILAANVVTSKIADLNITYGKLAAEIYKRIPIVGSIDAAGAWVGTAPTPPSPETSGIFTCVYTATGIYTITHNLAGATATNYVVQVTSMVAGIGCIVSVSSQSSTNFVVQTANSSFAAAPYPFSFALIRYI